LIQVHYRHNPNQTMAAEGVEQAAPSTSLVGERIRVQGKLATVRWGPGLLKGPPPKKASVVSAGAPAEAGATEVAAAQPVVEPAMVEVVGIEYDEPGNGKHDGTYQGERLFVCEQGFGSFVKVDKFEVGVSIQRAITEKYFENMLPSGAAEKGKRNQVIQELDFTDSKGREKTMPVEIVGRWNVEQQQGRLEAFMEVSFAETTLSTRYPEDVWEGDWSLPNMKSLWLDRTLIGDWADVLSFVELCPRLEWLSLAKTRLSPIEAGCCMRAPRGAPTKPQDSRIALEVFSCCVKTLVLNDTMVSWNDVLALEAAGRFPCLEHLHFARNRVAEGIPELEGSAARPKLKTLVLDGNGISDWNVLRRAVKTFPALEALHLNANSLGSNLEGLAAMAADQTPRRLATLFLSENQMDSWTAVGALSGYALLELKLQRNPITEGDKPLASAPLLRQVVVALMPSLLRLNASEVTVKERTASERFLLSMAQQEGNSMVASLSATCDIAAHVARLRGIHGEVVSATGTEEQQATRSALVHNLVEVSLRPIGAVVLDQPAIRKRLPHTMTVAELKQLCQTLFKKVPIDRISLLLADPCLPFGIPFDDESRELGFYGLLDGAEIRVDDIADSFSGKSVATVENLASQIGAEGEV